MDLILGRGNTGPVYPWFGQAIRDGIALAVENYAHYQKLVGLYRQRYAHYGHGTADQAIVGLGGHLSMRPSSQDAKAEFLPHFRATSFGQGVSMDSFMQQTPLTVGSPQEIIDRYAGLRDLYGDYQRQLFLLNLPTMSLKTSIEQFDALGQIVPVLRRELDRGRPDACEIPFPRIRRR